MILGTVYLCRVPYDTRHGFSESHDVCYLAWFIKATCLMILGTVLSKSYAIETWHGFIKVVCHMILGTVLSKSHDVCYMARFIKAVCHMILGTVF